MPNYRRALDHGPCFFFTVVTYRRQPFLVRDECRDALRMAIQTARKTPPFDIDAWVLLPDHIHCIWSLPPDDSDFPRRWNVIKSSFSRLMKDRLHQAERTTCSARRQRNLSIWQRRYWEHRIRDDDDFRRHMDYIHFNPVKHGLVRRVSDWPYSTFHRHVKNGSYPSEWADCSAGAEGQFGE